MIVFFHKLHAELGVDALTAEGYHVLGGYMSPVNDLYHKKVPRSSHRIPYLSDSYHVCRAKYCVEIRTFNGLSLLTLLFADQAATWI